MSYQALKQKLGKVKAGEVDPFSYLAELSAMTSLSGDEIETQAARDLLIRALEQESCFKGYRPILDALVKEVGLYPYLDTDACGARYQVAAEYHRPESMPEHVIFTSKQSEVYRLLMDGKSVVLSAPTSFGKSLIIDAVISSGTHGNIVIVVPTLALVDETRRRLMRFRSQYRVITHIGQEPGERNIFVHTQERVVENPHITKVDFFVIDEFYKLAIEKKDGDSRGVLLNQAFYKLSRSAKQFYMLGPNIDQLPDGFEKKFDCVFVRTTFSTVAFDTHQVPDGEDEAERLRKLVPKLKGSTLVFSASPPSARANAREIVKVSSPFKPDATLAMAIDWLSKNYSAKWGLIQALKRGVGTHHGKLPRSIAQLMVRLFNEGHLDYLVCTSTLIEGVNTAARNVVIASNKIGNSKYDFFTFNNIRGRSGRMWEHFVGQVYLFHAPPQKQLDFVDVPLFTQGDSAPDSLLIQLDRKELSPDALQRMKKVWSQNVLDIETIKANSGFEPMKQVELARDIEANISSYGQSLSWKGYPDYAQLEATLLLAAKHFGFRGSPDIKTAKQLVYRVNQYRIKPDFQSKLEEAIGVKTGDAADEAIEDFLEFTRQWLSFRVPRWLHVVERIQRVVLTRHGRIPGDYMAFASRLESLFMPSVIIALEEYGVPLQIGAKLHTQLGKPETLDGALRLLSQRRASQFNGLTAFEREFIEPLCLGGAASGVRKRRRPRPH